MDHERLLDDVAAYYTLVKTEHPDLSPDELVTLIADRIGLDAQLALAARERAAGSMKAGPRSRGSCTPSSTTITARGLDDHHSIRTH